MACTGSQALLQFTVLHKEVGGLVSPQVPWCPYSPPPLPPPRRFLHQFTDHNGGSWQTDGTAHLSTATTGHLPHMPLSLPHDMGLARPAPASAPSPFMTASAAWNALARKDDKVSVRLAAPVTLWQRSEEREVLVGQQHLVVVCVFV